MMNLQTVDVGIQSQLNKFTEEIKNLQNKCSERNDVPHSALSKLRTILQDVSAIKATLGQHKIVIGDSNQRSVERAIMAILSFQHQMPSLLDTKAMSEMFSKLFAVISVEMRKLEDVDKKLARQKRFGRKVEKTEKSKKTAE